MKLRYLLFLLLIAGGIMACPYPDIDDGGVDTETTTTTVDPELEDIEDQLDDLEAQIDAALDALNGLKTTNAGPGLNFGDDTILGPAGGLGRPVITVVGGTPSSGGTGSGGTGGGVFTGGGTGTGGNGLNVITTGGGGNVTAFGTVVAINNTSGTGSTSWTYHQEPVSVGPGTQITVPGLCIAKGEGFTQSPSTLAPM